MRVQHEQFQCDETILELQRRIDELTTENLLLKEQLTRKEQFVAMIAHELRSPLAPIINYAQMLVRQICSTKEDPRNAILRRHTNIIISQARRLSRLVNDLLDSSRLTSDQFTLLLGSCDIVSLAHELVEQLRPVAPYHTLIVEAPDSSITGTWDSGRLQQVLGNLLDNAIKYSDEGTVITVGISRTPETVHVSVHNHGTTIPPSEINLLFRPYTRLAASSTRQGSGLGLYITKSIIEAHGGQLRLEAHGEDTPEQALIGTTFSFDLPLESPPCKK